MSKVDFLKLNSANISCDNSVDGQRMYDIKANANLQGEKLASMDSGVVTKNGVQVASFNLWGEIFNPSFNGVADAAEMCAILMAITVFVEDVKAELASNPIQF